MALACAIIKINPQNFAINKYFNHYGFDSVNFTDLANQLNKKYQLEIAPTIFFEYTSIEALSQFLYNEYQERLVNYYYSERSKTVSPTLQQTPITGVMAEPLEEIKFKSRFTVSVPSNKELMPSTKMPIAIIGKSGIMPQSEDLESFWQHLEAGDDLITEVPTDRWDWQAYYGDSSVDVNKTKAKWGGFMPHIDQFDSLFFGISPKEAELMDPQQRLFLETVWKTIEDAGYKASDLSGSNTGLFVGVSTNDYYELLREYQTEIEAHTSTGMSHAVLANRVSYFLNLHGPSEPIDTACSSSLIAIHRAVETIASGHCNMAIAGGVNALLSPTLTLSFSKAGMLSEDGRCKTFDKRANGYVRGEGVGAILLKPLSQAQADGDHIYAIIKSTAENHGGQATSLTAPNPNAQTQLLIKAYKNADIDPSTISYIEAHGTGTSLGDPIEINGLKNAFTQLSKNSGQSLPTEAYCGLGSVKSNMGHLESAAGIAGVFKVLLSMQHKTLPANLHFKELNPHIQLQDSPFYIVKENRTWEALKDAKGQAIPRRSGVSSFGFGGANAHIVLEEYDNSQPQTDFAKQGTQLIVLSAKNEDRLQVYAKKMLDFLEQQEKNEGNQNYVNAFLANIVYTLQMGREAMAERLAIVVDNIQALRNKLTQYTQGQTEIAHFYRGNVQTSKAHSALLIEGEAGQAFLNMLIEKQELTKLAQLWILGVDIDWQLLYPKQHKPQRIALPTYPFARERYWIAKKETSLNRELEPVTQRIQSLPDEPPLNHIEAKSTLQSITKNHSLEAEIDDLKQLFSEALKLDIIHLDEHSMLEEFGVDSLVLMDVVQKMSRRYQLKLKISDLCLSRMQNISTNTGLILSKQNPSKNKALVKNGGIFNLTQSR